MLKNKIKIEKLKALRYQVEGLEAQFADARVLLGRGFGVVSGCFKSIKSVLDRKVTELTLGDYPTL